MDTRMPRHLLLFFTGTLICTGTAFTEETVSESIVVSTTIRSRFAETTVHSLMMNNRDKPRKVEFQVVLPHEAFVTEYSLNIDAVWHDGRVEGRTRATRLFGIARNRHVAGGVLETINKGVSVKTFKTATNIKGKSTVAFRLVYQQLLRRINGKFRHEISLVGSDLTKAMEIEVHICEWKPIFNVRALPIITGDGRVIKPNIDLEHGEYRNAASVYLLLPGDERLKSLLRSGGRFAVEYEMQADWKGTVIVDKRNFVQFFAPPVDIEPRRIVFLLDTSGSMLTDDNISHMKNAMYNIVEKLTEKDQFGVIAFDTGSTIWMSKPVLRPGTVSNVKSAIKFISGLHAEGYTEFYAPLMQAIKMLEKGVESDQSNNDPRSNYIVLITDGQPAAATKPKADESRWLRKIFTMNKKRFGIHAIGLGEYVDENIMRDLTVRNGGTWRHLSPNINTAIQIQTYLEDLGIAMLSNISLSHSDMVSTTTTLRPVDRGGEYIISGQLGDAQKSQQKTTFMTARDEKSGEVRMSMSFPAESMDTQCPRVEAAAASDFVEKAHCLLVVMDMLRSIDQMKNGGELDDLRRNATRLAKRCNLVTPLTSMIVLRPEDRKEVEIRYKKLWVAATTTQPPTILPTKMTVLPSWAELGDPHVVVHLTGDIFACFEVPGVGGEIFNFLQDPALGVVVNGRTSVSSKKGRISGTMRSLYVTEVAVILKEEGMLLKLTPFQVTTQKIVPGSKGNENQASLPIDLIERYKKSYGNVTISIENTPKSTKVSVSLSPETAFELRFRLRRKAHFDAHIDMEVFGTNHLSPNVGGLFGSFSRKNDTEVQVLKQNNGMFMKFRNKEIPVKRSIIGEKHEGSRIPCWHVRKPDALFESKISDFDMKTMTEDPLLLRG